MSVTSKQSEPVTATDLSAHLAAYFKEDGSSRVKKHTPVSVKLPGFVRAYVEEVTLDMDDDGAVIGLRVTVDYTQALPVQHVKFAVADFTEKSPLKGRTVVCAYADGIETTNIDYLTESLEDGEFRIVLASLEDGIEVGDTVRSYDFPYDIASPDRPESAGCYVEGVVETKGRFILFSNDCNRYKIRITKRVFRGVEDMQQVAGSRHVYPPVNGTPEARSGVCYGVQRITRDMRQS